MFYCKYLMHRLCTNIKFNYTFIPTRDEMSVGSVEKCTKHLQDLM